MSFLDTRHHDGVVYQAQENITYDADANFDPYQQNVSSSDVKDPNYGQDSKGSPIYNVRPADSWRTTHVPRTTSAMTYMGAVGATAVVPLLALAIWLAFAGSKPGIFDTFAGETIGGRLTQSQAKAIDIVCGALFAPLFMLSIDYIWFAVARVSVINERNNAKGVMLSTLVAASSTSEGTYNVFTLWSLVRGGSWRLIFMALLALLSAVAHTATQNIIAYEAYDVDVFSDTTYSLRSLQDPNIAALSKVGYGYLLNTAHVYSIPQLADIAQQVSGLLTSLNFNNATSKLTTNRTYIATNATADSMNSLDQSIVSLYNVPGYQLKTQCVPVRAKTFSVIALGTYKADITGTWYSGENSTIANLSTAEFPGQPADLQGATNDNIYFASFGNTAGPTGFLTGGATVLGYLASFNVSETWSSEYGDIKPTVLNMTTSGFKSTKAIMTTWGIECSILRQEGQLNYTRVPGQAWAIANSAFAGNWSLVRSSVYDWQTNINYHAPYGVSSPGVGVAFANSAGSMQGCASTNIGTSECPDPSGFWSTMVDNFLYASGEIERMAFNVAINNTDNAPASYFYSVPGDITVQFYRITYVPIILLFGLLSLIIASAITGSIMYHSLESLSGRTFRKVDVLRLVHDSVIGLWQDSGAWASMHGPSNAILRDWGKNYNVAYAVVEEETGPVVRLAQTHVAIGSGAMAQRP